MSHNALNPDSRAAMTTPMTATVPQVTAGSAGAEIYLEPVTLLFPIQTPNGPVNTITFRRGRAGDVVRVPRQSSGPPLRELALMAMLAKEILTPEDMEKLDLADLAEVQERFQKIYQRGA